MPRQALILNLERGIMKVSLKLDDQQQNQNPILVRAKIPITVFGLPFLSAFSATHHHAAAASDKLSLSLRSPNNSPLIISANFSFSPHNPNPNPTFSIQFKPRLGSFSLRKSVSSTVSNPSKKLNGGSTDGSENSFGFVPLDRPINWKELTVESATKDSILSGILMAANTELPITKRIKVNLRWGVNIPSDYEKHMPYLRVNKIKVERTDEVAEERENHKQGILGDSGELEMLKGMYSWISRELSDLQKENREMRRTLDDMKSVQPVRNYSGYTGGGGGGKRPVPVVENSEGFEQWRMKKSGGSGEGTAKGETKKNFSSVDVESELQRAIKAASS
ncbi:hypothetical protein LXL04_026185 [Taraxacum kok-saghyz]